MSEHMSDPHSTMHGQPRLDGMPFAGNGSVRPGGGPPEPGRGRSPLMWLLLAALLGFAGGIGGFAVANEVWDDDGSGGERFTTLSPSNSSSKDRPSNARAGDELDPGGIYDAVSPSVVHITAQISVTENSVFGVPQERRGEGTGSGFVVDDEGHIVTNAHVIENAKEISVSFGESRYEAELIGEDPSSDIAVIKVDPKEKGLENGLTPVAFGDSTDVRVGDPVVAIGNPFSLDRTLTTGVVSALQRNIPALDNDFTISNVIQTDAAVNPGNSGGPLLNMRGEVIGVNSQIQSRGGDFAGIAFAVPAQTVTRVADQLIEDGTAEHAWLGVVGAAIDEGVVDVFSLPVEQGVMVAEVADGSPAEEAGLQGGQREVIVDGTTYRVGGDIITEADGKPLTTMRQLIDLVNAKQPGDEVELTYYREDDKRETTVTLADRPKGSSSDG